MSLVLEPNDFKIGTIKGLKKKYLNETEIDNLQEIIFKTWGYTLVEEMNEYYFEKIFIVILTSKGFNKFKLILPQFKFKIIGYMFVKPIKIYRKIHFIDAIHSLVNGLNISTQLINFYEDHKKKLLIPRIILEDSVEFWKKYLNKKFNIVSNEDYNNFIKNNNLQDMTNWYKWY